MKFVPVRAFLTWQLMLLGVAAVVFWTYYGTLDLHVVGTMAGASSDTTQATMNGFLADQRAWLGHYWHAATDWRNQVYTGLTTPHSVSNS